PCGSTTRAPTSPRPGPYSTGAPWLTTPTGTTTRPWAGCSWPPGPPSPAPFPHEYDPPPLGWLLLAAWTTLPGAFNRAGTAIAAGREFMLALQLVSAALLYGVARRLGLRRPAAGGGVPAFRLLPPPR